MAFSRIPMVSVGLLALSLAACHRAASSDNQAALANAQLPALPAAVPLQPGAATAIATAPPVKALPASRPVRLASLARPSEAYAYLDRADGVANAIGDAPPDYAYDDGDVSPWAWQTDDGDVQYAEPIEGGYRYYYYEPGASTPYLVRGPRYSYGYAGDQLVAVFDDRGALMPPGDDDALLGDASRYYDRAVYLNRLAAEREHRGVIAANWAARRAEVAAARAQWADARAQQAAWQAYHDAHAAQEQDHWADERAQRQNEAQRFAQWQQAGFHRPPPAPIAAAVAPAAPAPVPRPGWRRDGDDRRSLQPAPPQEAQRPAPPAPRSDRSGRMQQQRPAPAAPGQDMVRQPPPARDRGVTVHWDAPAGPRPVAAMPTERRQAPDQHPQPVRVHEQAPPVRGHEPQARPPAEQGHPSAPRREEQPRSPAPPAQRDHAAAPQAHGPSAPPHNPAPPHNSAPPHENRPAGSDRPPHP